MPATAASRLWLDHVPAQDAALVARLTGGSSTGAGAAVATGRAGFTLGSDTTGSVGCPLPAPARSA